MLLIDSLLLLLLLWLGMKITFTKELFNAVIHFIVFGMVLSLVWVRLSAFDLALAEIALGAGITGVLLLDTITFLKKIRRDDA